MFEELERIIEESEKITLKGRIHFDRNVDSVFYGGIQSSLKDVKPTALWLPHAIASYLTDSSVYYLDEEVKNDITIGCACVARYQHEDGSFDYPSCNFHSAPDSSFILEALFQAWRILDTRDGDNLLASSKETLEHIFRKAETILVNGGFHTPNHRWAICSSLLQLKRWAKNPEAVQARVDLFLREGIDINEDGEYAERSTGNYNSVVNSSLLNIYEETGDQYFLDCVCSNLRSMAYFVEEDSSVFTNASSRQDRGKLVYMHAYFIQYLRVFYYTKENYFGDMARQILTISKHIDNYPAAYPDMFLHQELLELVLPITVTGRQEYKKFYRSSQLLRVQKEHYGYTLLGGQSTFCFLRFGKFILKLKIGQSLCEKRYFQADAMEVNDSDTSLKQTMDAWYYLPFEQAIDTSDWWAMNQDERPKYIENSVHTHMKVSEKENGLDFALKSEGLEHFPIRVEMHLPAGTQVFNEALYTDMQEGQLMIIKDGSFQLQYADMYLHVDGAFGEHEFLAHYSNEESKEGSAVIAFTAYTPVNRLFSITMNENQMKLMKSKNKG